MDMAGWKAAELEWGHGPRVFEMFLEPTCPFSNRAFGKIQELLSAAGEDKITVRVRLQSQPWHLYSGVIVRAILAASTLDDGREGSGRDAAWRVMEAVAAHRDEFEFEKHCTGPNRTATPNDILARIEHLSGVKLSAAFDIPDLDKAVKAHCRYARQNGIHVSPTFMIDGLVQPDMSSGDAVSVWAERLRGA
jgi:protein-disulfide isomerase